MNEFVDISFENCHENSLHGSFKYQFDRVLEELQLEQPCHDKQVTQIFAGFHDPVAAYMDNPCNSNGGLCLYSKDQSLYHNLWLISSPFLNKHDYGMKMIEKYEGCHVF